MKEKGKRKQSGKRKESGGHVTWRVTCTINNTKVVRTWYDETKGKRTNLVKTAGCRGYQNAKRGTVYAAQELRGKVAKEWREKKEGKKPVHVWRRGMGRGRVVALSTLKQAGRKIRTVSDATKDPHNGCRRKKKRRV